MKYQQQVLPASMYRSTHSLEFNGTDDWMACFSGFMDTFRIGKPQKSSISIWVRNTKNSTVTQQTIASRWFPTPSASINEGGWRIYLWDASGGGNPAVTRACVFQLSTWILEGLWVYSKTPFPFDEWVHVCLTYDGLGSVSGLKMYWNGVLQETWTIWGSWTTTAINSSAYTHLLWGCQYTAWGPGGAMPDWPPVLHYFFEGLMDECSLWRHELDADEVLQLYNNGYPINPLQVGRSASKETETWFRMGEKTDGAAWLFGLAICWGRWPVSGVFRNGFWNNSIPSRIVEEASPAP